ncbi:hypothetical protein [Paenibacillus jiagnxiensis]|uniref:hypothetical protein n=1 Tax=Paenibacillus jiagnxiensis TaxID=3228926 RepID=UPI0033A536C2
MTGRIGWLCSIKSEKNADRRAFKEDRPPCRRKLFLYASFPLKIKTKLLDAGTGNTAALLAITFSVLFWAQKPKSVLDRGTGAQQRKRAKKI